MKGFARGALIGAILSLGGAAMAQPVAMSIEIWSFGFSPHPIHLAAERPVTLTFVNRSGNRHDFTAGEFFASSRIMDGRAEGGEIELPPHATRTVTLVPRRGVYSAHCSHFMHKQLGMNDEIIVD
jgi:plastocyanin